MSNATEPSRRDFIGGGTAGVVALGAGFVAGQQRVLGANNRVRVAICGVRGDRKSVV